MPTSTDRIEKQIFLKAPRARVWKALTSPKEFGAWFGVDLSGEFKVGKTLRGPITHEGYTHLTWEGTVERLEPETLFAYRWHPHAVAPDKFDYASEPTTLVTFELEEQRGGTLLRVTESGFDQIPVARRAEAYRGNTGGWEEQMKNIEGYLGKTA